MRKLSRYLMGDYLAIFAMAMLLITFAFSIAAIYKAIDIMARGLPASIIGGFILNSLPYSIAYTIPISTLFSTLLLFGRLSSDSELSAMRSGGLSLWQVSAPIILFSVLLSGACLYNNCVIYPESDYANRQLFKGMGVEDPIKLLEEGRFIREFPGYMIYVGKKNRNRVRDLIVYEVGDDGKVATTVRAASGIITAEKESALLKIDLFDVRIEMPDPESPEDVTRTRYASAQKYPVRLDIGKLTGEKKVGRKRKNLTFPELAWRIRNSEKEYALLPPQARRIEVCRDRVEAHQRICLAMAPLMFVLIAIPLGITSHRKESSIGMLMSLGIMFLYYLFIIASDTLDKYPDIYPWLIPWIPILGGQIGGLWLLRRAN